MNKFLLFTFPFIANSIFCQSFAPAPGQIGSTAISLDSNIIVDWATGVTIQRGFLDAAIPNDGLASFGTETNCLGQADGNSVDVVSLGDGGVAILTFDAPIKNGSGPDFAVFENGFADHYLELAFVEVSSDGINFVRFPAISETPITTQIGPFEYSNCQYVHNLAGKYRQGFGTPFDLQDLIDSVGIDLNYITHVKLIDVVGTIDPIYGTYDSQGNIINDLYPTNFESGGFDLDALGVIHQNVAGIIEKELSFSIYPNPAINILNIQSNENIGIKIQDLDGRILISSDSNLNHQIDLSHLSSQVLFVLINNSNQTITRRIVKL